MPYGTAQVLYCNLLTEISSEFNTTTVNKPRQPKSQRNRRSRYKKIDKIGQVVAIVKSEQKNEGILRNRIVGNFVKRVLHGGEKQSIVAASSEVRWQRR